jgi:RNA polymerase sigma factor (sigma-70 family)
MASDVLKGVMGQLQRAAQRHGSANLSDADLLEGYLARRDESAFEELLRRHGPMVLGVCRRVLRNNADAEDAFQAAFLVLVRKAATIRPRSRLGGWLHGVAYHTALKASAMRRKRQTREREARTTPRPCSDDNAQQVQALVDGELSALPDKYRMPIVLCELQGKTIKEAARQLGWPEGTVASRLYHGRKLLAQRLTKRGWPLSGAALGAVLSGSGPAAGVPASLLSATSRAATLYGVGQAATTGVVSPSVVALAEGVLRDMLLTKVKMVTAVLLLGLVVGLLALLPALSRRAHSAAPPRAANKNVKGGDSDEPASVEFASNPINLLAAGGNEAMSVAFSPDGKRLAWGMGSWNRPGRVEVWDFTTRKSMWSWDEARGVMSVAFSPDSKRLAWTAWGGRLCIEQIEPRRNLVRLPLGESNYYVAHSGDRKWLALASQNQTLRLLEGATGRQIATLTGDSLAYFCAGFSTDSKLLAAGGGTFLRGPGSGPNQVNLFDVATRKQIGKLTGHSQAVSRVVFAPQDKLIAAASGDSTIRLWDAKTFEPLKTLSGHTAGINGLAFSADGTLLASGSWDRTIRLWDTARGTQVAQIDHPPGGVMDVAF